MDFHANDFDGMVARVQAGDRQARAQFSRDMEPHMARLLRRAQAQGENATALGRRLLQTAQRLDPEAPPALLAGRLSRLVLERLHPGSTDGAPFGATRAK